MTHFQQPSCWSVEITHYPLGRSHSLRLSLAPQATFVLVFDVGLLRGVQDQGLKPRLRTKTKTKGRQSERVDATRIDRVDISAAVI